MDHGTNSLDIFMISVIKIRKVRRCISKSNWQVYSFLKMLKTEELAFNFKLS